MSFSLKASELSTPRYALRCRVQKGSSLVGGLPTQVDFVLYCETFSDVKNRLRFNLQSASKSGSVIFVRTSDQWYASAVKTACFNRRIPYYVALIPLKDGYFAVWSVVAIRQ